jgi:branched-chain amino acid transport system substrate-binding protein
MWNVDTVGSYAFYAYDAAMILLEAIKKSGSTDTNKLADTLRNTTWNGVTGEIKFDHKGDRKLAHVIWIVKDGNFLPYWDPLTGQYF